ncbi:nucleoside-diphosphate-sugar epimerase [Novosphingobium chloroacetimidivorans]|uniref:Nucleoside-diphosphate-sugar epimerase n=1 Tax=Novosphingobium chloroacetimidivorans TaxID=1428314 RepID=A0A7W7K814_9SPHN|nr:NAD(P)-dependent oxidoreductase [Novosphingobium chloroacetimidivorans]MBB4857424.1 nucleoside-diphosphate-sugar epimerase [Novosphingobium chloroacetimidivorans]
MLDPRVAQALAASGRRVVITGAGGWLGLATLDSLASALGPQFARRIRAFGSSARTLHLRDGIDIEQRPLAELAALSAAPTFVLHFAFLTKDRAEEMDEAAYRTANEAIGDQVLAALEPIGAEAVFVASSGAAYKAHDAAASPAMRLYGELKLAEEDRFVAWAEAHGRRAVIARIFNVTGPYINKHQAYALASFILDGLAGRPIVVRAPREVMRGYVAIDELISLALAEMAAAPSGVVRFDSGGQALELGEVAHVVAGHFPRVTVDRAPIVEDGPDLYFGDDAAYQARLRRHGIVAQPLAEHVAKTIDYLRGGQ